MIRTPVFVLATLALLAASGPAGADANDDRQAVQDTRGGVVRNTTGNCVRTQWESEGDVCAPPAPPPPPKPVVVETPPPPPPPPVVHTIISEAARTVYFPFNKAGLTDEAKQQLDTLAETLKAARDIQEARVVGAADRIGSTGYNDKLSQKRAEAVRDYLIARGYTNASVTKTRWVGKSEPITSCSKKLPHKKLVACLQGDRRVQIEIVYKTEVVTPAKAAAAPTVIPPPAMPVMPVR
jgi:outer membrane protein OmpA-like peptidoglycan-associated protein